MSHSEVHFPKPSEFRALFREILAPEWDFYKVVIVYSLAISLLTLAVPISVQMLIDTVANTALVRAVILIASVLFGVLLLSGLLYALRAYVMELFNRHIFARLSSEIALTAINAKTAFFEEARRQELFNRFFDIMTLKKNVPHVLTGGFSLFLQALIGFTVVSLYHPYFFVFVVGLIILLYLVWRIWGWRAIDSVFHLSEAKYQTAAWLEGLTINNGFFKSRRHVQYALDQTDLVINRHVDEQVNHFRFHYRQLLSLLFLYALASAVLLGMGGWLVIRGELTLGQLVAAELIMSAIFAGFPLMGGYLDQFYDICAAVEELARFRQLPMELVQEPTAGQLPASGELHLEQVRVGEGRHRCQFDLHIPAGSRVQAYSQEVEVQRTFAHLLKRHQEAGGGAITLDNMDLMACNLYDLRQFVIVIDRPTLLPISISDYLKLANPEASSQDRFRALVTVGLEDLISCLDEGMDTLLSYDAWPLSIDQAARLKLAAAILAQPSLIILSQIFDMVDRAHIEQALKALTADGRNTVIYFTARESVGVFTHRLALEREHQQLTAVESGS
ncbi:MAG: ABC transporter ATP-binding protein [Wenzhouxiangellaceae bacterium]